MSREAVLIAVGDVAARRGDPSTMFRHVRPCLRAGDLVFGQLEAVISDRGSPAPQARLAMRTEPSLAPALRDAGFTVLSFAGNHSLDWGPEALADTLAHLAAAGIRCCGAGANLAESRAPARLAVGGIEVSVFACSSVLPAGYAATPERPGCAPLRVHTSYTAVEPDQPGTPARVETFAWRHDLEEIIADIRHARAQGGIVILSCHWGVHFVPAVIADYQRELAHAAIDAGADLVLGHHPHILKGIEVYRGRVIFYSLGNFAIEQPTAFRQDVLQTASFREIVVLNPRWRPDHKFVLPPEMRRTLLVRCTTSAAGIREVAFLPAYINEDAEPEVLAPGDARFDEILAYVRELSRDQGFATRFTPAGERVVVTAGE